MRIISGKHKSRNLLTLQGMNTRPMTDRMKETLFNVIGPYFDEGLVLDLFGGSGALSLEAISRGVKHAYIVDDSKEAIKVIKENVKALGEDDCVTIINSSYLTALKNLSNLDFDIVFLDPPYRMNVNNEIIETLINNKMLKKSSLIICQHVKGNMVIPDSFNLIKQYNYGSSELLILEYK